MSIFSKFTDHPHEIDETYVQHFCHAQKYTWKFLELFFCTMIHSIFPWMFNGYISGEVKKLNDHVTERLDGD
jgi:hypothetical protein